MFPCKGDLPSRFAVRAPKYRCDYFDPFSGLKRRFRHFPTPGDYLSVCENLKKKNCCDIQCVVEASKL